MKPYLSVAVLMAGMLWKPQRYLRFRRKSEPPPELGFGKDDAEISQGAIVSNKLLAGALQFIKDKQAEKDVEKLSELRTSACWRSARNASPKDGQSTSVLCE